MTLLVLVSRMVYPNRAVDQAFHVFITQHVVYTLNAGRKKKEKNNHKIVSNNRSNSTTANHTAISAVDVRTRRHSIIKIQQSYRRYTLKQKHLMQILQNQDDFREQR